jgi:hypothetical protein
MPQLSCRHIVLVALLLHQNAGYGTWNGIWDLSVGELLVLADVL